MNLAIAFNQRISKGLISIFHNPLNTLHVVVAGSDISIIERSKEKHCIPNDIFISIQKCLTGLQASIIINFMKLSVIMWFAQP